MDSSCPHQSARPVLPFRRGSTEAPRCPPAPVAGSYRGPAPQTCLLVDLTHSHREVGGSPRVPSSERFFFFSPLKYIQGRCNVRAMPSTVGVWQNTKYSLTAKGTRVSDACNELQHNPEPSGPSYSRPTEGHSHAKPPHPEPT